MSTARTYARVSNSQYMPAESLEQLSATRLLACLLSACRAPAAPQGFALRVVIGAVLCIGAFHLVGQRAQHLFGSSAADEVTKVDGGS